MTTTNHASTNGKSTKVQLPFAQRVAPQRAPVATAPTIIPTIVNVSPEIAAKWLAIENSRNRSISEGAVARYANDMLCGAWVSNGETIKFGADGSLLDGQHRLSAIVESGVTVPLMVVRGVSNTAQSTIDTGRPRSDTDNFRIQGMTHPQQRASILRNIKLILRGHVSGRLSVAEIHNLTARHGAGVEWVLTGLPGAPLKRSAIIAALAFAYPVAPDAMDKFYADYKSGANLAANSPALQLRKLATDRLPKFREVDRTISLKTLRALQAHLSGESIGILKPSESGLDYFRKALGLAVAE